METDYLRLFYRPYDKNPIGYPEQLKGITLKQSTTDI